MTLEAETFEDLYKHAPCGYLTLEPDGRIARVNATFLAWTGHDAQDLTGHRFQSLLNIAGKMYFETHFAPLLCLQGYFNEVAFDLVARDGSLIPVLVNALVRPVAADRSSLIRMTVFNATDRRHYERELLSARDVLEIANEELRAMNEELIETNEKLDRANNELRAFYDTLPVGIFRADQTGRIVQASPHFSALFGVSSPERWTDRLQDKEGVSLEAGWHHAVRDNKPFTRQIALANDAGALRCIKIRAVPIKGTEGQTWAFVGLVEDVTEQVRIEGQRRKVYRDAAIVQLTGGLAHHLNNLLTVIMGNLELLLDDMEEESTGHPILKTSLLASDRAAALVSRLLVYSGQGFARPTLIEIDKCLHSIATDLTGPIEPMHRLVCDLRAANAEIQMDSGMLKEAVQELVDNAVAAMPDGGEIRITSNVERRDADAEDWIIIEISDDGTGMDADMLVRAREPFFTGEEVPQRVGLGLSLVDGIARIAGGTLMLFSDPQQGTTAQLRIPVEAPEPR